MKYSQDSLFIFDAFFSVLPSYCWSHEIVGVRQCVTSINYFKLQSEQISDNFFSPNLAVVANESELSLKLNRVVNAKQAST